MPSNNPENVAVWTEEQYERSDDDVLSEDEDPDPVGQRGKEHYTNWKDDE